LEERRRGIGGSDAAAVMGLSPWASPLSLWVDKTRDVGGDEQSEAMEWGTALEHVIARRGAARHGLRIGPCPGILAHPDRMWQRVTVDRYALNRQRNPYGLVEVKNVTGWKDADWADDGPPPTHVVLQVQHGLDVTGFDVGFLLALVGGNRLRYWEIPRDDELIEGLREQEAAFWRLVTDGVPPAAIGHDADFDALALLHPDATEEAVTVDAATARRLDQRAELKRLIADMDAEVKAIDAQVLQAVGDARTALHPTAVDHRGKPRRVASVVRRTWTGIDQTALFEQHPAVYDQVTVTRPCKPYITVPRAPKEPRTDATP
jgi:putative phage-type endonuclease